MPNVEHGARTTSLPDSIRNNYLTLMLPGKMRTATPTGDSAGWCMEVGARPPRGGETRARADGGAAGRGLGWTGPPAPRRGPRSGSGGGGAASPHAPRPRHLLPRDNNTNYSPSQDADRPRHRCYHHEPYASYIQKGTVHS